MIPPTSPLRELTTRQLLDLYVTTLLEARNLASHSFTTDAAQRREQAETVAAELERRTL